jgi:hypothetical protein
MSQPLPLIAGLRLAAAETELACLKMALAQVKEDRDELRQERDDWRREAAKLSAEKFIDVKLAEIRIADRALLSASKPSPKQSARRGGDGSA